jgi:hypothetical protein
MKVLEPQLPEQTASKLQEATERFTVSPEQLSILTIEEKIAQLKDEFRRSAEYVLQKNVDFCQTFLMRFLSFQEAYRFCLLIRCYGYSTWCCY